MISVIIPNYNHSIFLKQRIESVLLQTYQNIELIILDDYSTDNSQEIIEQYRINPKVNKIVYSERNSGNTFIQWKKGIALAKGEFIWIAESDDWAEPEFLETLVAKYREDDNIGLVYCDSKIFTNNVFSTKYSDVKSNSLQNSKWTKDYINDGIFELNDSLLYSCTINNVSAVLFRKDVLIRIQPFDLKLKFIGDWYCYIKIASISKIGYVNRALNNYREHRNNTFNKVFKDYIFLREYFLLYNWVLNNIPIKDKKKILNSFQGYTSHKFAPAKNGLLKIYIELFMINKKLFLNLMGHKLLAKLNFINSRKIL